MFCLSSLFLALSRSGTKMEKNLFTGMARVETLQSNPKHAKVAVAKGGGVPPMIVDPLNFIAKRVSKGGTSTRARTTLSKTPNKSRNDMSISFNSTVMLFFVAF